MNWTQKHETKRIHIRIGIVKTKKILSFNITARIDSNKNAITTFTNTTVWNNKELSISKQTVHTIVHDPLPDRFILKPMNSLLVPCMSHVFFHIKNLNFLNRTNPDELSRLLSYMTSSNFLRLFLPMQLGIKKIVVSWAK